ERVVAADLQLVRESFEEAAAVVPDDARLPVHELTGRADLPTERLHDRLVPEADAERRDAGVTHERHDALRRPAWPGRDDEPLRLQPVEVGRVVAPHDDVRAELAEEVREVVRERVVVVDQQDHRCSVSARSTAASTAASLRRHSSCSAAGSESATMPAPAWRCATPSWSTIVRMAMHVSSVRSSGSA